MLEKLSLPGPSAGKGALLIAGYFYRGSELFTEAHGIYILTSVVFTPHGAVSSLGALALGVEMYSKSLSEPLTLCDCEDMVGDVAQMIVGCWEFTCTAAPK